MVNWELSRNHVDLIKVVDCGRAQHEEGTTDLGTIIVIVIVGLFLVCAVVAGVYGLYLHHRSQKYINCLPLISPHQHKHINTLIFTHEMCCTVTKEPGTETAYNRFFLQCTKEVLSTAQSMPVLDKRELLDLTMIGEGSSARVYRATWHNVNVAVKQLKHPMELAMDSMVSELANEIILWSQLSYPSIVQFLGVTQDLWLVMEFMEHGTLANVVLRPEPGLVLADDDLVELMLQASRGMEYLHSRTIIHRDLNPNNIMITGPATRLEAKLADFGLSRISAAAAASLRQTRSVGTPTYCAPEVLVDSAFSFKSDVFGFGMSLWFALEHQDPFPDARDQFDIQSMVAFHNQRPHPVANPELQAIIAQCWQQDPAARPLFPEVSSALEHYLVSVGRLEP